MKYIFTYPLRLIWAIVVLVLYFFFGSIGCILYTIWNFKLPEIKASFLEWDANSEFSKFFNEENKDFIYPSILHWAIKHPIK